MYSIFRNLALILISAKFFALLARKCRAPQVVGEILAGLIIGPCVLNLVQTSDAISTFAEIGVVMLMFTTGCAFVDAVFEACSAFSLGVFSVGVASAGKPASLFILSA